MSTVDFFLGKIGEKYALKETDARGMGRIKASGMTFEVKAFDAEGLGRVSVMSAKGFFGLMKMNTVIANPLYVDLPLYSYDLIAAMGNYTLITELYDTVLGEFDETALLDVVKKYGFVPDRDPGEHWYDSIKLASSVSKKTDKKDSGLLGSLARNHFAEFIKTDAPAVTDVETKKKKAAVYVEGLLENGGPSTDAFIKAIGAEKTGELFRKVLFGLE
ncbi:MAG: hypothetical protein J6V10_03435 [Clostridia bacterium]|nr:hypothetical protein [Clostridia bacterium]